MAPKKRAAGETNGAGKRKKRKDSDEFDDFDDEDGGASFGGAGTDGDATDYSEVVSG